MRRGAVTGAALLSLTIFLPVGVYDALWSRYLTDQGASTLFIGIGLSLYSLPIVLLAPTGGRVADRIGPVRATALAICLIIPLTVTYGLLAAPVAITAMGLLESFPQSLATPSVQTAMLRACRPDEVAAGARPFVALDLQERTMGFEPVGHVRRLANGLLKAESPTSDGPYMRINLGLDDFIRALETQDEAEMRLHGSWLGHIVGKTGRGTIVLEGKGKATIDGHPFASPKTIPVPAGPHLVVIGSRRAEVMVAANASVRIAPASGKLP